MYTTVCNYSLFKTVCMLTLVCFTKALFAHNDRRNVTVQHADSHIQSNITGSYSEIHEVNVTVNTDNSFQNRTETISLANEEQNATTTLIGRNKTVLTDVANHNKNMTDSSTKMNVTLDM